MNNCKELFTDMRVCVTAYLLTHKISQKTITIKEWTWNKLHFGYALFAVNAQSCIKNGVLMVQKSMRFYRDKILKGEIFFNCFSLNSSQLAHQFANDDGKIGDDNGILCSSGGNGAKN